MKDGVTDDVDMLYMGDMIMWIGYMSRELY
jgi:hypothetical protein